LSQQRENHRLGHNEEEVLELTVNE
jgi:hypothetical protein